MHKELSEHVQRLIKLFLLHIKVKYSLKMTKRKNKNWFPAVKIAWNHIAKLWQSSQNMPWVQHMQDIHQNVQQRWQKLHTECVSSNDWRSVGHFVQHIRNNFRDHHDYCFGILAESKSIFQCCKKSNIKLVKIIYMYFGTLLLNMLQFWILKVWHKSNHILISRLHGIFYLQTRLTRSQSV